MAFSSNASANPQVDMNITPLIDVMLVLLVIFMIAAPIFSTPIPLSLSGTPQSDLKPTPPIELRIDAAGEVFVDGQAIPMAALPSVFSAEVVRAGERLPALKVEADGLVEYEVVTKVLAAAENAGLRNIAIRP